MQTPCPMAAAVPRPGRRANAMSALALVVMTSFVTNSQAKPHRSHAQVAAFKHEHPCPSTGKGRGRCPGYIVDHVKPLCAGGPDRPSNIRWQTVADAKAKDRVETAVPTPVSWRLAAG